MLNIREFSNHVNATDSVNIGTRRCGKTFYFLLKVGAGIAVGDVILEVQSCVQPTVRIDWLV